MELTIQFSDYEPWGENATRAWDKIKYYGKTDDLESFLEDNYGHREDASGYCGMSTTELNDLLAYETDWVYKSLGIQPDDPDSHSVEDVGRKWCEDEGYSFVSARWTDEKDGCDTIEVTYRAEDGEDEESETLDETDVQSLYEADGVEMLYDNEVVYTWVYDC